MDFAETMGELAGLNGQEIVVFALGLGASEPLMLLSGRQKGGEPENGPDDPGERWLVHLENPSGAESYPPGAYYVDESDFIDASWDEDRDMLTIRMQSGTLEIMPGA